MWLPLFTLLGLTSVFLHSIGQAEFLQSSDQCATGEYWCQDRCGSDAYGDTCCQTPDGQYNMCGAEGTCCQFGCCRYGGTCNAEGACDFVVTTTATDGSVVTTTTTEDAGGKTTVLGTATSTATSKQTITQSNGQSSLTIDTQGQPIKSTTQNQVPTESLTAISYTGSDGVVIISSAGNIWKGTESTRLPVVTALSTFTIFDETFTLQPASTGSTGFVVNPPGEVTVIGTETVTLPSVSAASTYTTLGIVITLVPSSAHTLTVIGTETATLPIVTETRTITTLGTTIVLSPLAAETTTITSGTTPVPPPLTSTLEDGRTLVSSSGIVIIGTDIYTVPSGITTPVTSTGNAVTLTFLPSPFPDTTTVANPSPTTTTSTDSAGVVTTVDTATTGTITSIVNPTETLQTYTTWPTGVALMPTGISVNAPEPTVDGTIIPCKLWFFWICINLEIPEASWFFKVAPGVYPPGPPPPLHLPQGSIILGNLPEWPKITVGTDHKLTYPTEPKSGSCTKPTPPASLCEVTTSFGISVSEGTTITTTTATITQSCTTDNGCQSIDSTIVATTTGPCSTITATDAWVSCTAASDEACTTTRTSVVSGCDVTATTRSCKPPAATGVVGRANDDDSCTSESKLYAVFPKDSYNVADNQAIADKLVAYVSDPNLVYTSASEVDKAINFWRLNLTQEQGNELHALDTIGDILEECDGDCYDPTISTVYQSFARSDAGIGDTDDQLVRISLPAGVDISTFSSLYYFDDSAGENVPVFIVDTGASLDHEEFDLIRDKVEWIHVGKDFNQVNGVNNENDCQVDRRDSSQRKGGQKAHGTSMLSAASGLSKGVSKKVKPILVRMPQRSPSGAGFTLTDFLDGLQKVADYYPDESSETRAILLLAVYYPVDNIIAAWDKGADSFAEEVYARLKQIIAKGILPIAGSGNSVTRGVSGWPPLDGVPASFGKPNTARTINELLVVGGINPTTNILYERTNMDISGVPHVFAPAVDVSVANGDTNDWPTKLYKSSTGTSEACAFTVGLAAYFLKLYQQGELLTLEDPSPKGLKDYIIDLSVGKFYDGRPTDGTGETWQKTGSIWNGFDPNSLRVVPACKWQSNPLEKRQTNQVCELPISDPPTGHSTSGPSATQATGNATGTGTQIAISPTSTGTSPTDTATSTASNDDIPCMPFAGCQPSTLSTSTVSQIPCQPFVGCQPTSVTSESSTTTTSKVETTVYEPTTTTNPTPTSTQAHIPPSPTEGVYIFFLQTIVSNVESGISAGAIWNMYDKTLDGSDLDVCTARPLGDILASWDISPKSVPWPPNFSISGDISGRNGCRYISSSDGPGQFACDGVDAFACLSHDENNQEIDCDTTGLAQTFVPKVQCLFPL